MIKNQELINKKIMLYGASEKDVLRLKKYELLSRIAFNLSDYYEDIKNQALMKWGIKTRYVEETDMDSDTLVVICRLYYKVENRLQFLCLKQYLNYVSIDLFECILSGKKLMVLMGGTPLMQICRKLQEQQEIAEYFICRFFHESDLKKIDVRENAEYVSLLTVCDVYLYEINEKSYFLLPPAPPMVKNECITMGIPAGSFPGYHPQLHPLNGIWNRYLFRGHHIPEKDYRLYSLSQTDKILEDEIEKGTSKEEILYYVTKNDVFTREQAEKHWERTVEKIMWLEEKSDIIISDFVRKNKKELLFKDCYGWNGALLNHVASLIGEKIGILFLCDSMNDFGEELEIPEVPVYPSVLYHLGIQEEYLNKEYTITTYYGKQKMSFNKYMKYAIDCIGHAMKLQQLYDGRPIKDERTMLDYLWTFLYKKGSFIVFYEGYYRSRLCEFADNINAIADKIQQKTQLMNELIGIYMKPGFEMVEAAWGIMLSGNYYMIIPKKEVSVQDLDPNIKLILCSSYMQDEVWAGKKQFLYRELIKDAEETRQIQSNTGGIDIVYKDAGTGLVVNQTQLISKMRLLNQKCGLTIRSRIGTFAMLEEKIGICAVCLCMMSMGTLVMLSRTLLEDPGRLKEELNKNDITELFISQKDMGVLGAVLKKNHIRYINIDKVIMDTSVEDDMYKKYFPYADIIYEVE